MALEDRTRRKIIEMYRAGKKTQEITNATGAPRSTIYFLLSQEGITPRRKGGPRTAERPPLNADDRQKLDWAIERITELDQEVERMRGALGAAASAMRSGDGMG